MTTTPTFWGTEVTFSFDPFAFSPQVTGLADDSFAIVWENGGDIFGRHLDPFGSFAGGDFLSAVPSAKPLGIPHIVQQADGRVVVNYSLTFGATPLDRDVFWHSPDATFTPQSGTSPIEDSATDEILIDSAARSDGVGGIGSAVIFAVAGSGNVTYTVLRFVSSIGTQASNQIFVGPHTGESQLEAAVAGRHTGHVVVAYDNVNLTSGDRQIRFHGYAADGSDTTGEVNVSADDVSASFPDVTALHDGSFVLTWQQDDGIAFRRYFGEATPIDASPVSVANSAGGLLPKITPLNDGGFIIAWTAIVGTETDGSPELDVVLQRFDAGGTAIGAQLDLDAPGDQGLFSMSIATLADGRVILTYASETGDSTNIDTLNYRIVDPRDPTIFGTNGDDTIVGREDASTISGFGGADELIGRGAADILNGNEGNDMLEGNAGKDQLFGGNDTDTLVGGGGQDMLNGGPGKDFLTGGPGKDGFVFDSALSAATNVDVIDDFTPGKDHIYLSKGIFTKIGNKLGAGEFRVGHAAHDKNDFVIYNANKGKLIYDKNGSKHGGDTLFARLDTHLDLDHADFIMIA